ncbi:MAG: Planctomycete cytochrome [Verrucomicrobiales bacterium]|nr:Planctomycete cytochrome [Verrucomicrobiales bacterium]
MSVHKQKLSKRLRKATLFLSVTSPPLGCLIFIFFEICLSAPAQESLEFFESKIRPVLVEKCYPCHSLQAEKLKGELRLDSLDGLLRGGAHGLVIVPGEPEKSRLLTAISYLDTELQMPPRKPLSQATVRDFEHWIRTGAIHPQNLQTAPTPPLKPQKEQRLWSTIPVKIPPLPPPSGLGKINNEIDLFVQQKWIEKKLTPSHTADKITLIRRATYDLTGVPPTLDEFKAFLADRSANAYPSLVDRLLASRRYGERWGRHWLDIARYSDTAGDSADFPIEDAYKYRNYVIDAFNSDKPYDAFLRQQIAGDLLPFSTEEEHWENIIATGYVALSKRFGVTPDAMHLTLDDTIDTLGHGILGLSLGCARCHDHKYDPITMDDYYGLYGIFNSTAYPFPGAQDANRPRGLTPLVSSQIVSELLEPTRQKQKLFLDRLASVKSERASLDTSSPTGFARLQQLNLEFTNAVQEINRLFDDAPAFETAFALKEGAPSNTPIFLRGDPTRPGREVPRKFVDILGGQHLLDTNQSGRLELANWLADPENPLTARVLVNRVWHWHFGRGIVATPGEFGSRGDPPSNPELLDYLAARFIQEGWSIKNLHRLIMTSRTYMQASDDSRLNSLKDPANLYFWRFNRQRLDAEEIRDSLLQLSGQLDWSQGMEHPLPERKLWNFTQHRPFLAAYDTKKRSIYLLQTRSVRNPILETLDGADPTAVIDIRTRGSSPHQALFFLNNDIVHTSAQRLAPLLLQEKSLYKRIDKTFQAILGRPPGFMEKSRTLWFIHAFSVTQKVSEESAAPWESLCRSLFAANEFLFVD